MTVAPPSPAPLDADTLVTLLEERFGAGLALSREAPGLLVRVLDLSLLRALSKFLFWEAGGSFGGLIVEQRTSEWTLQYLFLLRRIGWVDVVVRAPLPQKNIPSIVAEVHAADWYEREAEDLFGVDFEGHPRLGDFILHNETWQEQIAPMRKAFNVNGHGFERKPDPEWRTTLVVQDPGSFAMPVGPVYEGGLGEPVHFLLETVGEDVIREVPRLFYKYRAVEKVAEGKSVPEVLLLAERFSATSAFAHSLAFCQAIENAAHVEIPRRASRLRVVLAELERLRHHAGAIEGICQSTALSVSEAHAAIIEEQLLRASGALTGHRYLFGLNTPGGLSRDFEETACRDLLRAIDDAGSELRTLEDRLRYSSSFLDRLEDVGAISRESARDLDLVGPVGRASGVARDLRKACPYASYSDYEFDVPRQEEGDGYARLRILFAEARESARLIHQAIESLEPGAISIPLDAPRSMVAFGWAEAPIGAALHGLRLDSEGLVERYRILTPSFRNWLGFHVAVEDFAFQDFPIILATFGLSVTECDR
ncbi:MAG TPA: NADH-quinone oxidoreductase subunit C [Bryobacteraceae bacterium]|nr:NADH-quinone oxidoreductase subunit C [Bryobacteraceae bacterium]